MPAVGLSEERSRRHTGCRQSKARIGDVARLAVWWRVKRSLCVARPLGVYAVEWEPTEWRDEMFGRLGGAFRGNPPVP